MTKKELLKELEEWDDDTELEVSIPMDWDHPFDGGRIWAKIDCVEPRREKEEHHCLINVSEVTMA
uniref:Uncharacterized protein n=1 Tax=viral metagenome TaxID=1070528 RepID=A0A6H2A6J8_9ZZZZ